MRAERYCRVGYAILGGSSLKRPNATSGRQPDPTGRDGNATAHPDDDPSDTALFLHATMAWAPPSSLNAQDA
eukprot:9466886-Pyramimonas_sp.AAC.1